MRPFNYFIVLNLELSFHVAFEFDIFIQMGSKDRSRWQYMSSLELKQSQKCGGVKLATAVLALRLLYL